MKAVTDIAVLGAGPFGLSQVARLAGRGADIRAFGSPMRTWLQHMPKGMHLNLDGFMFGGDFAARRPSPRLARDRR